MLDIDKRKELAMGETGQMAKNEPAVAGDAQTDQNDRKIVEKMAIAIAIFFVTCVTIFLVWLAMAVAGFACSNCSYVGGSFPWIVVNSFNSNSSVFSNIISALAGLIAFGAGYLSSKNETRRWLYYMTALSLAGFLISFGLLLFANNGLAWTKLGMNEFLYQPPDEFQDAKIDLFTSHMNSFFGPLALWYATMLAARVGYRLEDLKQVLPRPS